jgi:ubiquinone/menaquinone biosynthesis C-methylase UbiE
MNLEALAETRPGRSALRALAAVMESRLRYRFFGPQQMLEGADVRCGLAVLEVGCGTGFFTLPAAQLLGGQGSLVALDRLPASVEVVSAKVSAAGLQNVRVVEGNALDTRLEAESMDLILIFGVIPAPMLPMDRLLAEMHRVLKPGGGMAVWPPSWVHWQVCRSSLFSYAGCRHGVLKYRTAAARPARTGHAPQGGEPRGGSNAL